MAFTTLTDGEFAAIRRTAFELMMFRDVVTEHAASTEHTEFCCKVAETYRVTLEAHENRMPKGDNQIEKVSGIQTARTSGTGTGKGGQEKMATERQVDYVRSLMSSRVVTGPERETWDTMLKVGLTSSQASSIITRLKERALSAKAESVKAARMATDAQKNYAASLLENKIWDKAVDVETLSFDEASTLISALKEAPRKPRAKAESKEGVYLFEGQFVKVQVAIHGSGRQYTKVFDPETESWERKGGLLGKLKPEHKVTEEQAARFGALYGQCIRCARTLTDEYSIEHGYGPVCAERMGF